MNVAVARTEAESELLGQFARLAPELPGGAWMPAARARAMQALAASGLPHRRIEAWKYTDLRAALKVAHPPARCSSLKVTAELLRTALGPELAALPAIRLVLVNGRMAARLVPEGHAPGTAYHCGSLAAALGQSDHDWMATSFAMHEDAGGDPIMALNTAFATDGVVLRITAGTRLSLPIHIVSISDGTRDAAIATRHLIRVDAGARAAIVESHVSAARPAAARQATAVTQLSVDEGAEAHHILHLTAGAEDMHLTRLDVELARGSVFRGFQLTAGAGLARHESRVRFTGPDARLDLSGLMLGRGTDHLDTTLVVDHTTTGCESRELFKAVLDDRARAVFQGKIVVAPEAQKTDGKQMAQALMLSEDAEFDSKPELEIYADDVACGHGSTAAELDADMLFYLRSRGIPFAEARELLIESFVTEALEKIEDDAVREAARAVALAWLRTAP